MARQKNKEVTLFATTIILVLMAIAVAAVGAWNIWWFNQPTSEQPRSRLDLNAATVSELATLPGIDLSTAERIVSERPYNGPDDLVQKNIISQATYDKIREQIVAKQQSPRDRSGVERGIDMNH
jgi:helix-hairpin-helix protein